MNTGDEFRVLSITAILGRGFPTASFGCGVARDPHLVHAGSTDPGPCYLGGRTPRSWESRQP